nr:hypothetical protein [uncultured Butyrivibrio sp.]
MTIKEVLKQLNQWNYSYEFYGSEDDEIIGFSDPKSYRYKTAIWIGKEEDIDFRKIKRKSDIELLLVKPGVINVDDYKNVILTDVPKICFMKLVVYLNPSFINNNVESDVIKGSSVEIGDSYIGHRVIIGNNVHIGNKCKICSDVFIGDDTVIGDNVVIGEKTIIGGETNGSSFTDTDGEMYIMPNLGGVEIRDNVQIGANSIICKGTFSNTIIGRGCEINAGCLIGHNCEIGDETLLLGRVTMHGNVSVGSHSKIISSIIKNRVRIGDGVTVGIGSVVLKDIADNNTCFGNPARIVPLAK